jgi:hypothetical protein
MAEEVVASFSGPLNSFSINLTLENASKSDVRAVGISSRTGKFPIIWDTFGVSSGPATVTSIQGIDTEVVLVRFANFGPGISVTFNGIDPDFNGDTSSGVRVLDISGSRVIVMFADGTTAFDEFQPTDSGALRAVVTK